MKIQYPFQYLLLISLIFISFSCTEKDNSNQPNPTIRLVVDTYFTSQDTTLALGETIKIGILAETHSDVPLTHFNYSNLNELDTVSIDSGIYTQDFVWTKLITKNLAETENWSFTIHDKDGRPSSVFLTIFKADSSEFGEILYYKDIVLGAQNSSEFGNFYSYDLNQVFSLEEAFQQQEKMDLVYFFDLIEGEESTIASPGASIHESVFTGDFGLNNWNSTNTTRFSLADISIDQFNNITNDSLIHITNFEFASGKRKSKNLKTGDIYAFNNDNKKGLFIVTQVIGTNDGSIGIEIKIQK